MIVTKERFKKAPLGTPFMVCCPICERDDGSIAIKKSGKGDPNEHFGIGDKLAGDPCTWCVARASIIEQTGEEIIGVASAQIGDKIVAFITIDKDDDSVLIASGKLLHLKHGDILNVEEDGKGFKIIERRANEVNPTKQ